MPSLWLERSPHRICRDPHRRLQLLQLLYVQHHHTISSATSSSTSLEPRGPVLQGSALASTDSPESLSGRHPIFWNATYFCFLFFVICHARRFCHRGSKLSLCSQLETQEHHKTSRYRLDMENSGAAPLVRQAHPAVTTSLADPHAQLPGHRPSLAHCSPAIKVTQPQSSRRPGIGTSPKPVRDLMPLCSPDPRTELSSQHRNHLGGRLLPTPRFIKHLRS